MKFNATEHPISWFRREYIDGRLRLKPPYQRNPVWGSKQKCYLIESILLGLPVPEIFIQTETSSRGEATHWIVDGQQRVRSVLQFVGAEEDPSEIEFNKFVLDKLKPESQWYNKSFNDLTEEEKTLFYEYKFAVRYLATDSDERIRDVFKRLNKNLTALNAQELRNAQYTGPFYGMIITLANNDYWAENRIITAAQIRRMKDLEFVSNLVIGVMHGPQGGAPRYVDEYYNIYEEYDDEFPEQRTTKRIFQDALSIVQLTFPKIKEERWGNMTDFYTLFVAISQLLRTRNFKKSSIKQMKEVLTAFGKMVSIRLADETADVGADVIRYVRAVEKGANDKMRRANRHEVILSRLDKFFVEKK